MIIFLFIFAVLWLSGGTATYRRLGGYRLAQVELNYKHECKRLKYRYAASGRYSTCVKCGCFKNLFEENVNSVFYRSHKTTCGKCVCTQEQLEADRQKALVAKNKKALTGAAFRAYTMWPGYVSAYLMVNASRVYVNMLGGKDAFFISPKMIETREERLASLDAQIKAAELEAGIK